MRRSDSSNKGPVSDETVSNTKSKTSPYVSLNYSLLCAVLGKKLALRVADSSAVKAGGLALSLQTYHERRCYSGHATAKTSAFLSTRISRNSFLFLAYNNKLQLLLSIHYPNFYIGVQVLVFPFSFASSTAIGTLPKHPSKP